GLAAYFLWTNRLERPLNPNWLLVAAALLVVAGTATRLAPTNPPLIEYVGESVSLRFWTKKSSLLFPRECLTAHWSVVGAESVSFNGDEVYVTDKTRSRGRYCIEFGGLPTLTLRHADGTTSTHSLPVDIMLPGAPGEAAFSAFQALGLALAGLVFTPLLAFGARDLWRARRWREALALAGCLLLALLTFLPFGFAGAAHWEIWVNSAAIQGLHDVKHRGEEVSRFFVLMPHILATLLARDSFIGFNLAHFALHFGKAALFYGILRQLDARPLYAFLIAVLAVAYPVNEGLLSLRSLPLTNNVFWLLAAVFLALVYLKKPRRFILLSVFMALLYNVASNESGYLLIFALPGLFWLRKEPSRCLCLTVSAAWYLPPVFKAAYLLLLELTHRPYYSRGGQYGTAQSTEARLGEIVRSLVHVYERTIFGGWRDAIQSLGESVWLGHALLSLLCIAATAWLLSRQDESPEPSPRALLAGILGGLLAVALAAGVFVILGRHQFGNWRIFFYVPFGAAVAAFCLLMLLTANIHNQRARDYALIALCLLLLLPGLAWHLGQQSWYRQSADSKARILHKIVSLVPRPKPNTDLLVMTDMDQQTMQGLGIAELAQGAMIDSALWLVYDEFAPAGATFCLSQSVCGRHHSQDMAFRAADPAAALQKALLFHLDSDLNVTLVEDPAAWLGWDIAGDYDSSRLYTADAPLPPRANSMLGAALRRQ
ncbi:MAG: hypothetical protein OXE95_12990, partial [Chloroflexi bacterium]|nr:hypothetical protein [Chloroflexota bacterium]